VYKKGFLTAKFAKKAQRPQSGNCLFINRRLPYAPAPFFAVVLSDQLLTQTQDAVSGTVSSIVAISCNYIVFFGIFREEHRFVNSIETYSHDKK